MSSPNSDLKTAYQGLARAFEDLNLEQELVLKLRANRKDTNDAGAAFRKMRQALEAYEEDRRQPAARLVHESRLQDAHGRKPCARDSG